jgi:hypothetical protein
MNFAVFLTSSSSEFFKHSVSETGSIDTVRTSQEFFQCPCIEGTLSNGLN